MSYKFTVSAILASLGLLAFAAAPASGTTFTMTFDEYGNCTTTFGTCSSFVAQTDPTSTASKKAPPGVPVLIFNLPAPTFSGNENILDASGAISDHLRWLTGPDPGGGLAPWSDLACTAGSTPCATMMIFYSLDSLGAPADTGPIAFSTTLPFVTENADGTFTYPAPSGNTYNGISDVPLPGALPLFATGLGALGLLGWRRKRKVN